MKTLANCMIMLAATAAGFGTMAYGQTQITAEIPFAFSVGSAMLPPGSYLFYSQSLGAVPKMVLENAASHHAVFAVGAPLDFYSKADHPSAVFVCVNGGCSLSAIKTERGTLNYAQHKAAKGKGDFASVVSIPLTSRKPD
jgi:hypothetical protein